MQLNPPKQITFWISILLGVLGLLGFFVSALTPYAFWLLLIGFVLLVAGLVVKGL
jgi:hypothetical protein